MPGLRFSRQNATRLGCARMPSGVDVRFDVASVTVDRGEFVVEVIEGAF